MAIVATGAAVGTNNLGLLVQQDSTPETLAYSDETATPIEENAAGLVVQDVSLALAEDTTAEGAISFTTSQGQVSLKLNEKTGLGRVNVPVDVSAGLPGVERTDEFVFTYTPSPDGFGSDIIPFEICDLNQECVDGAISITVRSVNDVPTVEALADQVVRPGQRVSVSPQVRDVENDPLEFTVTGLPAGVSYDPDTGAISGRINSSARSGRYQVTVVVAEQANPSVSDTTTFEIIIPDAQDPNAIGYPVTAAEDTPIRIDLPGYTGGESLVYSIAAAPQNGSLGGIGAVRTTTAGGGDQAASIVYTPSANYSGADEFAFRICNRDDRCSQATIRIKVTPVNDTPVLSPMADVATLIGGSVSVPIAASDVESSPSISVTGLPAWLRYDQTNGRIVGTAPNGSAGYTTTITVRASDGVDPSLAATRTFRLSVGFADPRANPGVLSIDEDSSGLVTLGASTESGALTFSVPSGQSLTGQAGFANPLSSGQSRGTRSAATNQLRYTPAPNFSGTESLDYRVCDVDGRCDDATVTVVVNPVNDAPLLGSLSYSIDEDTTLDVFAQTVLDSATDPEGDTLSLSWQTPTNGSLQGLGGLVRFTPDSNFNGAASIRYEVCDYRGGCTVGQIAITVAPVNDYPSLTVPGPQTIHLGDSVNLAVSATDVDGDTITFEALNLPPGLTIDPATGQITGLVPDNLGQGSFTASIKAIDGTTFVVSSIEFTVEAMVRDLSALGMTTAEDTPGVATFEGATDLATITFTIASGPNHGTASNLTPTGGGGVPFVNSAFFGSFDYVPDPDYHGPDSVIIAIHDQATGALQANLTVPITVTPVNDIPVVAPVTDQTYNLGETVSIPVSATDVDGDTLTYFATDLPAGLTMDPVTGIISGTLPTNATQANYEVLVKVDDGTTTCDITFLITLVQPAAGPDDYEVTEDTTTTLQVEVQTTFSADITVVGGPSHGAVTNLTTPVGDGTPALGSYTVSFDYTPDPDSFGTDQLTIEACNTVFPTDCDTLDVDIVVLAVNDAPFVHHHAPIPITAGSAVSVTATASDVEYDPLTFSATNLPPGLTIDPSTGVISGTFSSPSPPAYYDATITVTDAGTPNKSGIKIYRFTVN